jgi:5,10-methylenetetrahydrofolate reductase
MNAGSNLEKVLRGGHFAVTGELGPPQNADAAVIARKAAILKGYVDAVNLTDNQTAVVRMSSIAAGVLVLQHGLEPVIQMTCRDRNRIAMQSDLLGAYALGMRNLLCLTGDHQSFGNHPTSKNVFDLDSLQLLQMVANLRDKRCFQCGDEIKGQEPRFFVGAASNPFADPFDWRPFRVGKKAMAGADFIQTQLIYNVPRFAEFMRRLREMGLHEKVFMLAGVGPIKTAGAARYMRDKVPGMDVPNEIVERMDKAVAEIPKGTTEEEKKAEKKARAEAWKEEGIRICVDIINQVREIPGVAGIHLMAIEWEEAVPVIIKRANLYPRPVVE